MRTADTVLMQMSEILDLPIKAPLRESLRSKQDIRKYIIRTENEDSTDAERYADEKTLEAFGLIPKGFPLDAYMLRTLTDQVAGLYDPISKEFYIADWIPASEQSSVMAHELTHALEDQSFDVDPWIKAVRTNYDAEAARQAVSEGSALAAMFDYGMRDAKTGVRDMPDVGNLLRSGSVGQTNPDDDPAKSPPYIEDSLLFPYLAGTVFTQQFLKAHTGLGRPEAGISKPARFHAANPASQSLPLWGRCPRTSGCPPGAVLLPANSKFLEENMMGENFWTKF